MDAQIQKRGSYFHLIFRLHGQRYQRSLKTSSEDEALRLAIIAQDALTRIERGWLAIPTEADIGAFVANGGRSLEQPNKPASPKLIATAHAYLDASKASPDTKYTSRIHINHLVRLVQDYPLEKIDLPIVQKYTNRRTSEGVVGLTVKKEIQTLRAIFRYAYKNGIVSSLPKWDISDIEFTKLTSKLPFKTHDEIQAKINRGGLGDDEIQALWHSLYLNSNDLNELLDYVRDLDLPSYVYPMICFVALTGCRRSEMLRIQIDDFDFTNDIVAIREKKRSKKHDITFRHVDIHPRLKLVMEQWFQDIKGQFTINDDGKPLTRKQAHTALQVALRTHDRFKNISGFHCFRHSVASILASKSVDPRYIDKVLGHTTDEMRSRYQHLLPKGTRAAIEALI